MDRKVFFDEVRASLFNGTLSQGQVDGLNAILDEWERRKWGDLRWLAYMLATAYHEVARTMQPIEEYGHGAGHEYGKPDPVTGEVYYGRGLVQLTWKANYQKMSALVGVDLVTNPAMALQLPIAVQIMFDGMRDGLFTGVGLQRYFNPALDDPFNARRIINGTDCAEQIASYHARFLKALKGAA